MNTALLCNITCPDISDAARLYQPCRIMYLGVNTPKDLIVEMPISKLTCNRVFQRCPTRCQLVAQLEPQLGPQLQNFKFRIRKFCEVEVEVAGTTTIDTPSPIWNVRDCDTLVHNRQTPDLERQGLRHSVDDWAPVCQKSTKSVDGCV